jgi:hypothetical protein
MTCMTPHSRKLSVLVAVLLALSVGVVGVVGTATASGTVSKITAGKVKKIAKKVVAKQAPTLTVGNATNLGGLPATAYQDNAQFYSSTVAASTSAATLTLPLTPGKYYVSWSAFLSLSASTGRAGCWINDDNGPNPTTYTADDISDPGSTGAGFSGAGLVDVAAGDVVTLYCSYTSGTFTTGTGDPLQVLAFPLDSVTSTSLVATRPGPAAARP